MAKKKVAYNFENRVMGQTHSDEFWNISGQEVQYSILNFQTYISMCFQGLGEKNNT